MKFAKYLNVKNYSPEVTSGRWQNRPPQHYFSHKNALRNYSEIKNITLSSPELSGAVGKPTGPTESREAISSKRNDHFSLLHPPSSWPNATHREVL